LDEGFVVKDASAYNIQWIGARPVFIDLPSFQRHEEGEPWIGYLQFCQLFLYPLMLTAYRGLPFQPWLRGSLEGISPEECADLLSLRDRLRPGVFLDVYLQSRLQRAASGRRVSARREVQRSGFSAEMIRRNVRRLMKVVDRLEWRQDRSTWSEYEREHGYDEADLAAKRSFVGRALERRRWSLVWDLGANTGAYSKLAANSAEYVVSMDADRLAVERLYRELAPGEREVGNLLPLVQNIGDPSPSQGWRLAERRSLAARGAPDLVLALALVHHLVLGANIPLDEVVTWLADLGGHLVIEWVGRSDPMVERLLLNKEDLFRDYERETFDRLLEERFEVLERHELDSGTRVLVLARPRP
ncbi:MAG: class I SAM-dependent methyltransferase, partial [Thermoanaerobaculia bacterium]|nr:class I SAM-dependent methyltransferase [Thermoanaerobaculia bacterium]